MITDILYPLKFSPILKERVWGGTRLNEVYSIASIGGSKKFGECWVLSSLKDNKSIVADGTLAGMTIDDVIERFKEKLLGANIYSQFGNTFPLLIKFIDTSEFLSVQVHPDNKIAKDAHNSFGKSEMWYVLSSQCDSSIISGFNRSISKDGYITILQEGTIKEYLKHEATGPDDFFYIPSGTVHAIGPGISLVEIQQASDITYRIYDWDRKNSNSTSRELHSMLAANAIKFDESPASPRLKLDINYNVPQQLVESQFFTTNRICLTQNITRNFESLDVFRLYICVEGKLSIQVNSFNNVEVEEGELALMPACIKAAELKPKGSAKVLEVFVNTHKYGCNAN